MLRVIGRVALGAALGILCGALSLAMILGRASLLAGGRRPPAARIAQQPGFALIYLAAFVVVGVFLGAFAPLRRTLLGALALGVAAAAGFLTALLVVLQGPPMLWPVSVWWVFAVGTALVGLAVAAQLHQPRR